MGTVNNLEVARAIITQSPEIRNAGGQALNKVTIGTSDKPGYLVLDGNFYANNGLNVYGDVYSTGNLDFCPSTSDFITGNLYVAGETHPKGTLTIGGDAYLKGGVNPNTNINDAGTGTGGCGGQANGGVVNVGGNSTIQGDFVYWNNGGGGGLGFHVANNMVMDNGVINLTRQSGNGTDSLAAYGNVYIKNALTGTVPDANTRPIPFFGNSSNTVCVPPASVDLYRTNSTSINTLICNNPPENWGADPMDGSRGEDSKDFKAKLGDENNRSCENTPIQFNKDIYEKVQSENPPNWVHREDKPGSCALNNNNDKKMKLAASGEWVGLGTELQDCWDKVKDKSGELYDGEWLVIYIKDKWFFQGQGALTSGKYILIFDIDPSSSNVNELPLPPTSTDAQVMLYFPKGYPGKIVLSGEQLGTGYRYFLFSDGNIQQFDVTSSRKLHGNVFMNNCSVMNSGYQGNPYFISEGNSDLVKELMDLGALCKNPMDGSRIGCQESSGGGNSSNSGGSSSSVSQNNDIADKYLIPIGPRLKVALESKYISREKLPETSEDNFPTPTILVMPRVLYLGQNDLDGKNISDYYSLLYLNGGKPPTQENKPEPECKNATGSTITGNTAASPQGVYRCTLPDQNGIKVSPFVIKITGASNIRSVFLDQKIYKIDDNTIDGCVYINIKTDKKGGDCDVSINLDGATNDWAYGECGSAPVTILSDENQKLACTVCTKPEVPRPESMFIILHSENTNYCQEDTKNGRDNAEISKDNRVTVTREEAVQSKILQSSDIPLLSEWPDCPATNWTLNSSPVGACTPSGNSWKCETGTAIELVPPTETPTGSCELIETIGSLTHTLLGLDYAFEASYKRKPVFLSVVNSTSDGNNLTVSITGSPYFAPLSVNQFPCPTLNSLNQQCQFMLYHGMPYSISIPGASRLQYNSNPISSPYPLTPTADGILTILPPREGACDAEKTLDTYCPNTNWGDVKWNVSPTANNGNNNPAGCYYIVDASSFNISGNWLLNGNNRNGQVNANSFPPKVDDGYYVYFASTTWGQGTDVVTGFQPFCVDNVHRLSCSMPSSGYVGFPIAYNLTCRSGDAPIITSWTGAPNWNSPAVGDYNVVVRATCGSSASLDANCGTLSITDPAASAIPLEFNGESTYSLTNGATYIVTCSDENKALMCIIPANPPYSFEVNGNAITINGGNNANNTPFNAYTGIANNTNNKCANGTLLKAGQDGFSCKNRDVWW
jgi:hypothetical protein